MNIEFYGGLTEMDAPYTFLFDNYLELVKMTKTDPVLQPLVAFLVDNYKAEYEGAKNLFNNGLVLVLHIGKLFHPNTIVIARNEETGVARAGILSDCALTEAGGVTLRGWC
jgi:hypothetical protein